jgi:hypothetical protein
VVGGRPIRAVVLTDGDAAPVVGGRLIRAVALTDGVDVPHVLAPLASGTR